MMKKTMILMAALLCCAMTTTVFTACGGDDDNSSSTPEVPKIVGCQVDYELSIPETIVDLNETFGNYYLLCDKIEVGYYDENGTEQRETINNGKWSKSVTYTKPLDGTVKLYLTKPASIDVDRLPYDKYTCKVDKKPSSVGDITVFYSDGTKAKGTGSNFQVAEVNTPLSFVKSKAQMYFDDFIKNEDYVMTIKFNF